MKYDIFSIVDKDDITFSVNMILVFGQEIEDNLP